MVMGEQKKEIAFVKGKKISAQRDFMASTRPADLSRGLINGNDLHSSCAFIPA